MTPTTPTRQKRTDCDPRPRTILLGIDSQGNHHVWRRDLNRVHVVDPETGVRHDRVQFHGELLDDWMQQVAHGTGWAKQVYGVGLVELLAETIEG